MKNYGLVSWLICCASLEFLSCTHDSQPPMSTGEILQCHLKTEWTEESTRDSLLGKWRLEYFDNFWTNESDGYKWSFEFTIEFKTDSTLIITVKEDTTETANWHIVKGDEDYYEIESDPLISEISGRIIFCDDLVEFYASYKDYWDTYFRKVD